MLRFAPLLLLALPAGCNPGCDGADAQDSPEIAAWYDAEPLLPSLRRSARAELPAAAAREDLTTLPLYDLDLTVRPREASYTLTEKLYYTNETGAPLSEVVLRVHGNAIPGPPLIRLTGAHCRGTRCDVTIDNRSALTLRPAEAIPPNGRLLVVVRLEGDLRRIDASRTNMISQGLEGLLSMGGNERTGDYGLLSFGDGIASLANFYAVVARRDANGWVREDGSTMGDLGSDRMGHVRAAVRVPPGTRVVTTGITTGTAIEGPDEVHTVVAGMVRDFTVLASDQLEVVSRRVGDVEVRSWFLPADRAAGDRVLDAAAESLAVFERRFGAYPYVDLDVVEAPLVGGAGGVEFAGLVTIASMLYRPLLAGLMSMLSGVLGQGAEPPAGIGVDSLQSGMLEFTVAHEVAHQFWHGLVGSDSRQHPFVDESLAQYSAMLYVEDRYGADRAQRDGDAYVKMNYHAMRMMGEADSAVDRPVDAFASTMSYAGLIYGKGPYLYPALREAVGDDAFFAALREYVDRYRYRVAPNRGFVDVLASRADAATVEPIARRWLDEAHGDEDLGSPDLGSMMSAVLGPDSMEQIGPQLEQVMEMLGQLGMGTGVGAGGGNPTFPEASELEESMRILLGEGANDGTGVGTETAPAP